MKRILALIFVASCASNPEIPKASGPSTADQAQVQTLLEKANTLWMAAKSLQDVEPVMAAYEEVLKLQPDQRDALIAASRMHYYHGNDVLPHDEKDKRLASHLKGREQGLRAMALNAKWRDAYEKDNDIQKQMPLLGLEDTPAMYWAALNWAKWGELYGIVRAAIDIPKVRALMEEVQRKNPTYEGNAPDRFFAGYWVAIPGFAGKDPKKSKASYEKAVKESPQCLNNHVTFAEYYAKDADDRALFDATLKKVLDAPDAPPGPNYFLSGVAKEQARGLQAHAKELFE